VGEIDEAKATLTDDFLDAVAADVGRGQGRNRRAAFPVRVQPRFGRDRSRRRQSTGCLLVASRVCNAPHCGIFYQKRPRVLSASAFDPKETGVEVILGTLADWVVYAKRLYRLVHRLGKTSVTFNDGFERM
jgi:hypothetical protein